ncbi:hypothetical protein [uncultured Microbulbifer sp.]|uniref:hypothetical protein n=1 Tax=uncultured Microbulbifer sp. TaxID=348147 RepID=UPI00262A3E69|nr:hypothetical protein [uncultured Microbulbifer sp.]
MLVCQANDLKDGCQIVRYRCTDGFWYPVYTGLFMLSLRQLQAQKKARILRAKLVAGGWDPASREEAIDQADQIEAP